MNKKLSQNNKRFFFYETLFCFVLANKYLGSSSHKLFAAKKLPSYSVFCIVLEKLWLVWLLGIY